MTTTDSGASVEVLSSVADPVRIAVLQATGLLQREADATLDSFARLAAALLQTPEAYVTLVAGEAQLSPGAAVELDSASPPGRTLGLQESICQFQVVTGEPLIIDDTRKDPLSQRKAAVRDGSMLAYAGVPLMTRGGHVLGSLCVVDQRPRQWTPKQVELLGELARLVISDIEHRLAASRVASAEALGRRAGESTASLLEAVSDLVELAQHEADPRLQRAAAKARSRSVALERIVGDLSEVVEELEVTTPPGRSPVDLGRTVERAVAGARLSTGTTELDLVLPREHVLITGDPLRLEQALVHLLVSALHHKAEGEHLQVRLVGEQQEGASHATATLTLDALASQVPAAELGRIVARFRAATGDSPDAPDGPAALRMVSGAVEAHSGSVSARSSARALSFRAEWPTTSLRGDRRSLSP